MMCYNYCLYRVYAHLMYGKVYVHLARPGSFVDVTFDSQTWLTDLWLFAFKYFGPDWYCRKDAF